MIHKPTFGIALSRDVDNRLADYLHPPISDDDIPDEVKEQQKWMNELEKLSSNQDYIALLEKEQSLIDAALPKDVSQSYKDIEGVFLLHPIISQVNQLSKHCDYELVATTKRASNWSFNTIDNPIENFFYENKIKSIKPWCFEGMSLYELDKSFISSSVYNVSGFNKTNMGTARYCPVITKNEITKVHEDIARHVAKGRSGEFLFYSISTNQGEVTPDCEVTYRYKLQETHALIPVEYMRKFISDHPDVEVWKDDEIEPSFQTPEYNLIYDTAYKVSDIQQSEIITIDNVEYYWMPNIKAITPVSVNDMQTYANNYPDFLYYNYLPMDFVKQQSIGKDIDGNDCYCVPIWEIPTISFQVTQQELTQFKTDHPSEKYNGFSPELIEKFLCRSKTYYVKASSLSEVYPYNPSPYTYQHSNYWWSIKSYSSSYNNTTDSSRYNGKTKTQWDEYPRFLTKDGDGAYIAYPKTGSYDSAYFSFYTIALIRDIVEGRESIELGQGHFKDAFNESKLGNFIGDGAFIKDIASSFNKCPNLLQVNLMSSSGFENKLESISNGSFSNCPHLIAVILPPTVTSISADSFQNCPKLKYVYYEGTIPNTFWGDDVQVLPYVHDEDEHVILPVEVTNEIQEEADLIEDSEGSSETPGRKPTIKPPKHNVIN